MNQIKFSCHFAFSRRIFDKILCCFYVFRKIIVFLLGEVARKCGHIGDTVALLFKDKPLLNAQGFQSVIHFGLRHIMNSKKAKENRIIRSLAFKWIRIMFRCWKTNTPYDEPKYLEALKRRGSPLLKFAINS